ncbi:hypothetical protein ACVWXO_001779 [Bradyrhizobium sp. LM2.7]
MTSKYSPLRRLRLAVHEQRQRFRRGVAQPFVDGEAVALRLRDLLAFLVEKELVIEAFRRSAAEGLRDRAGQLHGVDEVLAGHLVVDAERGPAHRPVGLPLALDVAAGDGRFDFLVGIGIDIGDRAGGDVAADHRHLEHDAGGLADREERRIGRAAVRPQRRQDDGHHLVVGGQHLQQRRVEAA